MNAYELATNLDCSSSDMEYGYAVSDWKLLSDAADMLRQQADRIAELEKELKEANSVLDTLHCGSGERILGK